MKSKLTKLQKRQRKRTADLKAAHAKQIDTWRQTVEHLQDVLNDRRKSFYSYSDHLCNIRSELLKEGNLLQYRGYLEAKEQQIHSHNGKSVYRDLIKGFKLQDQRTLDLRALDRGDPLKFLRHELGILAQQLTEAFITQTLQLLPELGTR